VPPYRSYESPLDTPSRACYYAPTHGGKAMNVRRIDMYALEYYYPRRGVID